MGDADKHKNHGSAGQPARPGSPGGTSTRDRCLKLEAVGDFHFAADSFGPAEEYYSKACRFVSSAEGGLPILPRLLRKRAECFRRKGQYDSALEMLEEALTHLPEDLEGEVELGKLLSKKGKILAQVGKYRRALKISMRAHRILKKTKENEDVGETELCLGAVLSRLGEKERAKEYFNSALAAFRRADNFDGVALAMNNLALVYKDMCQWREAVHLLEESLRISQARGNYSRTAAYYLNLGIVQTKLCQWEKAERSLQKSGTIFRDVGDRAGEVRVKLASGNLCRRMERYEEAEERVSAALKACLENEYLREEVLCHEFLGEIRFDLGDSEGALEYLRRAVVRAELVAPGGDLVSEVCRRLAEVEFSTGEHDEARAYAERAYLIARRTADRLEEAASLAVIAATDHVAGQPKQAEAKWSSSLEILASIGEKYQMSSVLYAKGRALASDRRMESQREAIKALRDALHQFSELGLNFKCAQVSLDLAGAYLDAGELDESLSALDRSDRFEALSSSHLDEERRRRLRSRIESSLEKVPRERVGELGMMKEVAELLRSDLEESEILDGFLARIVEGVAAERGMIVLGSEDTEPDAVTVQGLSQREAGSLVKYFARQLGPGCWSGGPVVSTSVSRDRRFLKVPGVLSQAGSLILFPLSLPTGLSGAVFVDRSRKNSCGPFGVQELSLLGLLGNLTATAVLNYNRARIVMENSRLRAKLEARSYGSEIVTRSPKMVRILDLVGKVGRSRATVLLCGETGTGKGLLARAIHDSSPRKGKAFVQINCAALPEPLLESELFGHVQGAFTGAVKSKKGLFEEAEGGTIFLDEIEKVTPSVQGKLLRVLDNQEIRPVGGNRWKKVNARVVCATNVDLQQKIRSGGFLEDLFYRLNDIQINVPPLRERREDIPVLVEHFIQRFSDSLGKRVKGLSADATRALMEYAWPGNVRELEKAVQRMIVLADEDEIVSVELLPEEIAGAVSSSPLEPRREITLKEAVARLERNLIKAGLEQCDWNRSEVSRRLKISYPTLLQKIRQYGIKRDRK